ncbi:WD40-repeat-containing domain protein [Obelidium mucronatum]|nr:WD40-repeat-containing domain protein [Obelidium mucronatum]
MPPTNEKRKLAMNIPAANPHVAKKSKHKSKSEKTAAKVVAMQGEIDRVRTRVRLEADKLKDEEEIDLEDMVFGAAVGDGGSKLQSILAGGARHVATTSDLIGELVNELDGESVNGDQEELFVIDRRKPTIVGGSQTDDENDVATDAVIEQSKSQQAAALWVDTFDNDSQELKAVDIGAGSNRLRKLRESVDETKISTQEFEARLRKQFLKLHPSPEWATNPDPTLQENYQQQEGSTSLGSVNAVLRSTKAMIDRNMRVKLAKEHLDIFRMTDANDASPSQSIVQSCKFHPNAPVLLTAGQDKTLRLFHIDGKINPKIQSVFLKDFPIHCADFSADGRQVILAGMKKHFFVYDVEGGQAERIMGIRGRDEEMFNKFVVSPSGKFIAFLGRDGYIVLISGQSKQWIANLRMNGTCTAFDFSKDGRFLYSIGGDGEVYQWDLATRQCVHRFFDEGAVNVHHLAVSPDNSFIATGSSAGIVNVYSSSSALSTSKPTPSRALMNLTTGISNLSFHPSSQALLFSSRLKKDSLKIAHCPSLNVFANWPTESTPLGYVQSSAWSPGGGYLAVGNDKGKVLLYRATAFGAC